MNFKVWITAFRLRTLFLSLSCILMGLVLSYFYTGFIYNKVAVLTVLTALFLQILSNLANDYGDSVHGVDNLQRKGPKRSVQAGLISLKNMKLAVFLFSFLSFISGILLLTFAFKNIGINGILFLFICGLLAIAAAIFYTNGKKPYGYFGLGDISVFVFFGITSVLGTIYLQTGGLNILSILPAAALGFLSVGVLNINNMRDIESDKIAGKYSIPVKLGLQKAKIYHAILIMLAMVCLWLFAMQISISHWYAIAYLFLVMQIINIYKTTKSEDLDKFLKQLSLTTFLLVNLFLLCVLYV